MSHRRELAERNLIGCLLFGTAAAMEAVEANTDFRRGHLQDAVHQRIYDTVNNAWPAQWGIDQVAAAIASMVGDMGTAIRYVANLIEMADERTLVKDIQIISRRPLKLSNKQFTHDDNCSNIEKDAIRNAIQHSLTAGACWRAARAQRARRDFWESLARPHSAASARELRVFKPGESA